MGMPARYVVASKLLILLVIVCKDEIVANLLFLEISAKGFLTLAVTFLKDVL